MHRTILLDATTNSRARATFLVPPPPSGSFVGSNLRLTDWSAVCTDNTSAATALAAANAVYNPLIGAWAIIDNIRLLTFTGQEIDSLRNVRQYVGSSLFRDSADFQEGATTQLVGAACGVRENDEIDVSGRALNTRAQILVSAARPVLQLERVLSFLKSRQMLPREGFRIEVEYCQAGDIPNAIAVPTLAPSQTYIQAPSTLSWAMLQAPTLVYDLFPATEEIVAAAIQAVVSPKVYYSMVVETAVFTATASQSFFDQALRAPVGWHTRRMFIHLTYLNGSGAYLSNNGDVSCSRVAGQIINITINGRRLIPFNGFKTSAQQALYYADVFGSAQTSIGADSNPAVLPSNAVTPFCVPTTGGVGVGTWAPCGFLVNEVVNEALLSVNVPAGAVVITARIFSEVARKFNGIVSSRA